MNLVYGFYSVSIFLTMNLELTTCLQTFLNMNSSMIQMNSQQSHESNTSYQHTVRNRSEEDWYKEAKLLNYLLRNYNPNIIPREYNNESLKLYIGLAMSQLINLYDKEQVMKTNVWIHMWWKDYYLQWDHIDEFKEISSIRVPYEKVWTPDIILFNNAHGRYDVTHKSNVVLYKQGGVLWIPPSIYKSSCQIDVQYFPFDRQTCEMIFGSWVYHSNDLTLDYFENARYVDLHDYIPSGTWDILDVPASIEYYNDTNTNKSKVHMVYKIMMQRKSLFYVVNLIVPTFLISFLTVVVFFLPTHDGEKITLSLGLLFALVVFFLLISKIIPPTSIVVPLISKYLLIVFIMNILSVFTTCVVINIYFKNMSIDLMRPWARTLFFHILPVLLCIRRPKKLIRLARAPSRQNKPDLKSSFPESPRLNRDNFNKQFLEKNKRGKTNYDLVVEASTASRFLKQSSLYNCDKLYDLSTPQAQRKRALNPNVMKRNVLFKEPEVKKPSGPQYVTFDNIEITEGVIEASKSIQYMSQLMKNKAEMEEMREDWRYVAAVLDRLLLFIFALVTGIGTHQTLFDSPFIFIATHIRDYVGFRK